MEARLAMSCHCGCHDNKPPATGWKRFVPFIVGAVVVGVLIAGAVLKKHDADKAAAPSKAEPMTTAATP